VFSLGGRVGQKRLVLLARRELNVCQ
jgi:hypothetical protein